MKKTNRKNFLDTFGWKLGKSESNHNFSLPKTYLIQVIQFELSGQTTDTELKKSLDDTQGVRLFSEDYLDWLDTKSIKVRIHYNNQYSRSSLLNMM